MTDPFTRRWTLAARSRGPLCLGVAPSTKWLLAWSLPDTVAGARRYCETVLAAAGERLAGFRVQVPFFLRFGPAGLDLLAWYAARARDNGCLTLVDAKIGDADDTMDAYADLYLDAIGSDAVTAHPFLGLDSLAPLLRRAAASGAGVLTLVRTSNHQSGAVQTRPGADGRTLAATLADELTAWSEESGLGADTPAGAVVGAFPPESADLVARLPYGTLELPGLCRTGRSTAEVTAAAGPAWPRCMFPVTTGALRFGPEVTPLRRALVGWADELDRHVDASDLRRPSNGNPPR
jgi:orotidine-5'-phosphate decarboxylase